MALILQIVGFALFLFWLLLIARIVVEFIRSFRRDWQPRGGTVVSLEAVWCDRMVARYSTGR